MRRALLMLALVVVVAIYALSPGSGDTAAVKPMSESESPNSTKNPLERPVERKPTSKDSSQEGDGLDQPLAEDPVEPGVRFEKLICDVNVLRTSDEKVRAIDDTSIMSAS